MAGYRAKADLFVDGVAIKSGQEFDSENTPGRNWEPRDVGARARVKATFGDKPPAPIADTPNILRALAAEPAQPPAAEPAAEPEISRLPGVRSRTTPKDAK